MPDLTDDEITARAIEQARQYGPEPTREQALEAVHAAIEGWATSYWDRIGDRGVDDPEVLIDIRRLDIAARLLRECPDTTQREDHPMTDTTEVPITDQQPDTWAIVELFGHKKTAGKLSEQTIGGSSFVRVDVPDGADGFRTHLYGNAAIYGELAPGQRRAVDRRSPQRTVQQRVSHRALVRHQRMTPRRIQLRRTKGWRLPEGAVVVARPARWGNPYATDFYTMQHADGSPMAKREALPHQRAMAVRDFQHALGIGGILPFTEDDVRRELRGRDLACWCPLDGPCHADVLLEVAAR